jgi:hypothetical protein
MTRGLRLIGLVALAGTLTALSLKAQPAASLSQQTHRVMLGVIDPDPAAFDRLTGHHHSLHLSFSFGSQELLEKDAAAGRTSVITLAPTGLSSAAIANGAADSKLVEQARIANDFEGPVWIRPMPEMNGHWSPWCAVTASGGSRGAAYSARAFVRAFRRITIIMRGGSVAALDLKLKRTGLAPLRAGGAEISASGRVKLLWNPQGEGSPNVAGNRPRDYWPGAAFVDYVGDDLYEIGGKASWATMDAFYKAFPKPFVIGEWAPWGYDSPGFAQRMFTWARGHSRTIGLIYFNRGWSGGGSTFALKSKPRTLAVYRQAARQSVFQTG